MTTPTKACEHCGSPLKVRHKFSGDLVSPHQPASCRDSLRAQLDAARKERDDLQWRASTAEMALHTIEGPHGNIVAQLAKATSTASRWKADYEEKCRAYSSLYGELSAAKMALAAAGALPGVTAIVTVDSRGVETDRIAEAEQRGRRAGLNEALAGMACRTFLTEAERKGMTVAKARIRALLDGPGR